MRHFDKLRCSMIIRYDQYVQGLWYMMVLKIKAMVVDYRLRICRQLRANLLQTFQWPKEDTQVIPRGGGNCARIL